MGEIMKIKSIEDVKTGFREFGYISDNRIGTAVYLALALEKPLLVEGPAGVGKTELAKVLAKTLGCELLRLQCYEGLDESKALYEWEYAKQLLYTQILKDVIGESLKGARTLSEAVDRISREENAFFSEKFIMSRPLLKAISGTERKVLLIDEVDKSDAEFEAFLLEVLSDFQITIPEIGTISAKVRPHVVLTSNNSRELSDALKRRCLHLYIDFPPKNIELEIVKMKVPGISESLADEVVSVINRARKLDIKKMPSISETLDWARALMVLNAQTLDDTLVKDTMNVFLKYEADMRKAESEMRRLLLHKYAVEPGVPSPAVKKDNLH
jgi:MoxR-like ATPase